MSRIYDVATEKFGRVMVSRDSIDEARVFAKAAFGLGPKAVTVHIEYRLCPDCNCAPCCCSATEKIWRGNPHLVDGTGGSDRDGEP